MFGHYRHKEFCLIFFFSHIFKKINLLKNIHLIKDYFILDHSVNAYEINYNVCNVAIVLSKFWTANLISTFNRSAD